jgi:ABC-type transport system involved in cytochrome c biogenesis permease subunit
MYAAYLHACHTAGWRGKPAAMVATLGWTTMMISLFVDNVLARGCTPMPASSSASGGR